MHLLVLHSNADQAGAMCLQSSLWDRHVLLHDLACLPFGYLLSQCSLLRHLSICGGLHDTRRPQTCNGLGDVGLTTACLSEHGALPVLMSTHSLPPACIELICFNQHTCYAGAVCMHACSACSFFAACVAYLQKGNDQTQITVLHLELQNKPGCSSKTNMQP